MTKAHGLSYPDDQIEYVTSVVNEIGVDWLFDKTKAETHRFELVVHRVANYHNCVAITADMIPNEGPKGQLFVKSVAVDQRLPEARGWTNQFMRTVLGQLAEKSWRESTFFSADLIEAFEIREVA